MSVLRFKVVLLGEGTPRSATLYGSSLKFAKSQTSRGSQVTMHIQCQHVDLPVRRDEACLLPDKANVLFDPKKYRLTCFATCKSLPMDSHIAGRVGKTSLLVRFTRNQFSDREQATVQAAPFQPRPLVMGNQKVQTFQTSNSTLRDPKQEWRRIGART